MSECKLDYLYHGDCMDLLRQYPDNFFDCCISDIPYKIYGGGVFLTDEEPISSKNYRSSSGILNRYAAGFVTQNKEYEDYEKQKKRVQLLSKGQLFEYCDIKMEEWLPEIYRVLKQGTHIYLMVSGRYLKELQQKAEDVGFKYQNLLVWVKQNATPNKFYMKRTEFILMLRKGKERYLNDMGSTNVFTDTNQMGNKFHPTEKPISLMKKLILNSTNEGENVLDPFAGSGSTLLAAKQTKRRYVGAEIDKEFYDIASQRLEGYVDRKSSKLKKLF